MTGAYSLREPLVRYRRGGPSARRRWRSVEQFIARMQQTTRFGLVESEQFQRDADIAGVGDAMRAPKLARERYVMNIFAARGIGKKFGLLMRAKRVKLGYRVRMFLYAACPFVYRPFFAPSALVKR